MQISIVGNVCIDRNVSENSSYTAPGGPAVFMDKIFSQISDVTSTVVAPYGSDFIRVAKLPLFPLTPTNEKTLVYENISSKGKRAQKAHNREYANPVAITKELETILQATDILFFSPLLPNMPASYIERVQSFAKKDCLKVLLPQGYYRQFDKDNNVIHRTFRESAQILPLMDIVIVSEQDGKDMLHTAHMWANTYNIIVIVTLEERGAIAIEKGGRTDLPTTPVPHSEVVDSVGSGDIFSATFAYAYKKTQSLEKAGAYANKIAGECLFYPSDKIRLEPSLLTI